MRKFKRCYKKDKYDKKSSEIIKDYIWQLIFMIISLIFIIGIYCIYTGDYKLKDLVEERKKWNNGIIDIEKIDREKARLKRVKEWEEYKKRKDREKEEKVKKMIEIFKKIQKFK